MRLIDADALKNDLTRFYNNAVTAKQLIDEQPTIDAAPARHGRWIDWQWRTEDDWGCMNHRAIVCSSCERMIYDGEKTSYCPLCGALMDGGDDDV